MVRFVSTVIKLLFLNANFYVPSYVRTKLIISNFKREISSFKYTSRTRRYSPLLASTLLNSPSSTTSSCLSESLGMTETSIRSPFLMLRIHSCTHSHTYTQQTSTRSQHPGYYNAWRDVPRKRKEWKECSKGKERERKKKRGARTHMKFYIRACSRQNPGS